MANIYVRSTDGSDSDNGSTWALAKATGSGAASIDAAGDNIYFSQDHSESTAGAVTWSLAGTAASPTTLLGVSDAAEPPTSLSTKPTIATTGQSNFSIIGAAFRIENMRFVCGSGASGVNLSIGVTNTFYQATNCDFEIGVTDPASTMILATGNACVANLLNCTFKFSNASQYIRCSTSGVGRSLIIYGGGLASGTSAVTTLFTITDGAQRIECFDFDASAASSSFNIFAGGQNRGIGTIANSKLPASWSGSLVSGTLTIGERYSLYNCDSGNTNYRLSIASYAGNITDETTLVKTGGATDGTTGISWKCVTTANADDLVSPLKTDWMAVWNDTTGSSKTITVDILHDSATSLTDGDVWLEVEYLGTSSYPLAIIATDQRSSILATPADQSSSSATWTTTGMSNANKQKLEVTLTPQIKGVVRCRVNVAKASYTIYVDPEPVIS